VNLIYSTEPTTKKWEKRKTKKVKTDKLSSIGKQSGESVELVLKKKRELLRWERITKKKVLSLG